MTFDNSKTIIGIRIKLFLATILLLAYLAIAFVIKLVKFPWLGMGETAWTIIFVGTWVILALLPMVLNYQFVRYSDENEFIVFRYFNAGIVGGKKNSVEINKNTFSGYKSETRLFGLVESVTLFQKFPQGVAKYPPVYISALGKEEKSKLYRSLNSYSPQV